MCEIPYLREKPEGMIMFVNKLKWKANGKNYSFSGVKKYGVYQKFSEQN